MVTVELFYCNFINISDIRDLKVVFLLWSPQSNGLKQLMNENSDSKKTLNPIHLIHLPYLCKNKNKNDSGIWDFFRRHK